MSTIIPVIHGQSTCGPKVSARLLMDIPCDMSKTPFCEVSGTAYPWAAVRRYIYENQGLLRRMYGDQRHYQILTNEIQDLKEKYDNAFIYEKETKYHPNKRLPQFRPRAIAIDEQTGVDGSDGDDGSPLSETVSSTPLSAKPNFSGPNETSYNQAFSLNDEDTKKPSAAAATTTARPMEEESSDSNDDDDDGDDHPSRASVTTEETITTTANDLETPVTTRMIEENSSMVTSESSITPWDKSASSSSSTSTSSASSTSSSTAPTSTSSTIPSVNSMLSPSTPIEVKQETTKEPEVAKKGVNACPVKEEVIAPYWANNTRGEILALLNVYPFEQYVHWEKCAYENSQMFCRTGCRCEQQYRLHRLLAFDPKNECRGVFADWFRFPSCCVCICYDLPESNVVYKSKRRKSRL